jgi:Uma2 family endonuclease
MPKARTDIDYEAAAQAYLRSLPLTHFMEAIPQATQRKITLESLDLLAARRPNVRVFNELLVQYPRPGKRKLGQVVPDNMVVLSDQPVQAEGSFNVPRQPAGPFWVLEYVSKGNPRKDYDDSFDKYEQELTVPYYLVFYPDNQDLTLYRHSGKKYVSVRPNQHDRYAIPQLELEVALLDGWVRYWYQGELLPLPADLQRDLDDARRRADEEKRRADEEKRRADEEKRRADEEKQRADGERRRADEEEERANQAKRRADGLQRQADEEKRRADEEKRRADELQRRLEAMERESGHERPPNPPPSARRNTRSRPGS